MWTKKLFKNDEAVGTSVQAGLIIPLAALLVFGTALTSLATPNASELTRSVDYDAIDAASQIMNKLEGSGFASSGDGSDWHNADSSEKVEDPGLESSDERESTSSIPIDEEGSGESEEVDTPDTKYEVTFLVVDSTDESPIDAAMIRIAGLEDSTNSEGIAVFEVDPDSYSYRVLATGYILGMGFVQVSKDVTVKVGLKPSAANNAPVIQDMSYTSVYDSTNLELIVTVTSFVYEPDGDSPISYELDWGDGSSTTVGSVALGDSSGSIPSDPSSITETSSISDIQELQEYSMVNGYIDQYGTSGSIPSDSVLINEQHTYNIAPLIGSGFGQVVISYTIDLTVSDPSGLTDSEDLYISYIYDDGLNPFEPDDDDSDRQWDSTNPTMMGCWCPYNEEFGYGGHWSPSCSCPNNNAAANTQQTKGVQTNGETDLINDFNAGFSGSQVQAGV